MSEKPTYEELKNQVRELERFKSKFNRSEKDYIEQKHLLETVINELPFWFSLKDKNGRYLMVNKQLAEAHGTTVETFANRNTIETIELFNGGLEKMVERDKRVLKSGKRIDVPEYPVKISGEVRWRRLVKVPWIGNNKEILGVISWSEDITDLKNAMDEVIRYREHLEELVDRRTAKLDKEIIHRKKIEQRYRQLVENINDVIYSVDENGIVAFISPVVKNIMGYDSTEIIGKSFLEFVHEDDREYLEQRYIKVISGDLEPSEYRLLTKSGENIWIRSSSRPVYEENRFVGLRGVFSDISESKKIEERLRQSQKMESIGILAGGIAHEFNNMLAIIIGNTELAIDDIPEWSPAADSIQEIRTASLRAKDVVRKLLSVARKTPESRKPIQIHTIVNESLGFLRKTIPANIDIRSNLTRTNTMILGDPTEINQVLMNLCANSAQAMVDGNGVLEVTLESKTLNSRSSSRFKDIGPGDYVRLTISDDGIGIPPDILDRVLDPYFTTKDVDKGLGMGLAVVHGIVKKHDGDIKIDSEVGKGTKVEVLFPLIDEQPVSGGEDTERPSTGTERILFVDDEASLVKMYTQTLTRSGYDVVGKTSSQMALKLIEEAPERFDLVITDMAMPNMTGAELAKQIIRIRPDIPIILCTGHSNRMDEKKAMELGIKAFAMKPLGKADLTNTVREVLDEVKGSTQA